MNAFAKAICEGIPDVLPKPRALNSKWSHAPRRKAILSIEEKRLAVENALRYFNPKHHAELAPEFANELETYGRIYMYRFRPEYEMYARPIHEYPHRCIEAAAIMLMIQNNLDPRVAQHPEELITYGGNGSVFQNWAQYRLTMAYLAELQNTQTLVMYSGHPLGVFPALPFSPRVVVTNGLMIPNYSKPDDWERYNALGVTQYGQMTAGSYMYIGPQGIVHGTTITILNAARKRFPNTNDAQGALFVTCGLGGMSGAQPKAAKIAGLVSITAEINPHAVQKRLSQGWVDESHTDLDELMQCVNTAMQQKTARSFAYQGNIVELWERLVKDQVPVALGSDQSSLHNPWAGGYYPIGYTLEESNAMMAAQPERFKREVQATLVRHINAVNVLADRGMYFFDYGNAFLLEVSRAGGDVFISGTQRFKYNSYVQDILGPMCFDYGFGPFRWICSSGSAADLALTDRIALTVLETMLHDAPLEIIGQLKDNIAWIRDAANNNLVVGSQARILYADAEGRITIARAINAAVRSKEITAPVILGRDHHDVSGTDSPYRETSNIYDGSKFTADMAVHNFVGDAFRGATWVSLHNGGGVGWGEVVNGGFGLVLDGSAEADQKLELMLHWDVHNGISRRAWARNPEARLAITREMQKRSDLQVTLPQLVNPNILNTLF